MLRDPYDFHPSKRQKENPLNTIGMSIGSLVILELLSSAIDQWNRISRKQSARWQHLSRLKASAFSSLQKNLVVKKHNNLYLGLVALSSG
jgi:hypothetical protein